MSEVFGEAIAEDDLGEGEDGAGTDAENFRGAQAATQTDSVDSSGEVVVCILKKSGLN